MPTIEQARNWYQAADAVHDFDHVLRVYALADRLAILEGADVEIVHAAALLHDAEGAAELGEGAGSKADQRLEHHEQSARFAAKVLKEEGWPDDRIQAVAHCIRSHRFRAGEEPETLEAKVLFDADKLDAIGAIGAARALAYAVQAGQPLHAEPSDQFINTMEIEAGEVYTAYHEFLFKLARIRGRMYTESGKAMAAERHDYMEGFFAQLRAEVRGER